MADNTLRPDLSNRENWLGLVDRDKRTRLSALKAEIQTLKERIDNPQKALEEAQRAADAIHRITDANNRADVDILGLEAEVLDLTDQVRRL